VGGKLPPESLCQYRKKKPKVLLLDSEKTRRPSTKEVLRMKKKRGNGRAKIKGKTYRRIGLQGKAMRRNVNHESLLDPPMSLVVGGGGRMRRGQIFPYCVKLPIPSTFYKRHFHPATLSGFRLDGPHNPVGDTVGKEIRSFKYTVRDGAILRILVRWQKKEEGSPKVRHHPLGN